MGTHPMAASKRFGAPAVRRRRREAGVTMLEVMVSLLVTALGLLGLAGLQVQVQRAEFESYQRTQALILLHDMVDRINNNRATLSCFALTTNGASGSPFLGVGAAGTPACGFSTAANNAMADATIGEWDNLLKGSAESKGGTSVGAMVGARGCVSYDAATELASPVTGTVLPGTGVFTVAVSWQGTADTVAPAVSCGNTLYGPETRRRTVATTFRIAALN
jgi:type IV pilus assembly protein PilV